jgi:hypothetical protein
MRQTARTAEQSQSIMSCSQKAIVWLIGVTSDCSETTSNDTVNHGPRSTKSQCANAQIPPKHTICRELKTDSVWPVLGVLPFHMVYRCLGCGKTYGHKTGLNNHRRACDKWNNVNRVAKHKRRRLEGPNMGLNQGVAQPDDLSIEASIWLLLCT